MIILIKKECNLSELIKGWVKIYSLLIKGLNYCFFMVKSVANCHT